MQSETSLEGIKGRVADLTVTVQPDEYRSFTLKLAADADHQTSLTYDPYTSELTLDRSYAGSRADIVHRRSCKVRSQNGALKLRILLDKNTAPLWRRRSQSGAVFNEGEMKGISGHRFSSNCSAVTVALPSAAKVMPSADWGV